VQVRVRLGAGLARLSHAPLLSLDLQDGATVADLLDRLGDVAPDVARALPSTLPVLRGEHAARTRTLEPGDEVALLLPVSGGGDD
jgi:molybdopterin converting factor small subunit